MFGSVSQNHFCSSVGHQHMFHTLQVSGTLGHHRTCLRSAIATGYEGEAGLRERGRERER